MQNQQKCSSRWYTELYKSKREALDELLQQQASNGWNHSQGDAKSIAENKI